MYLQHESVCSKYYMCVNGIPVVQKCPAGLHFNPSIQACDYPESAGCLNGSSISSSLSTEVSLSTHPVTIAISSTEKISTVPVKCPVDNNGYALHLPHENNCSMFYTCDNRRKILQKCPPGLHFNPIIQVCDWPQNVKCRIIISQ